MAELRSIVHVGVDSGSLTIERDRIVTRMSVPSVLWAMSAIVSLFALIAFSIIDEYSSFGAGNGNRLLLIESCRHPIFFREESWLAR